MRLTLIVINQLISDERKLYAQDQRAQKKRNGNTKSQCQYLKLELYYSPCAVSSLSAPSLYLDLGGSGPSSVAPPLHRSGALWRQATRLLQATRLDPRKADLANGCKRL